MIPPKLVFVVDDEPGFCDTLQDLLEDEGYEVRTAMDGSRALALLRALDRQPCIILSDLLMPILDGHGLYQAVRADPALAKIPFLFMSTDPSRAPAGEPAIRKPIDVDAILAAVKRY